MTVIIAASVRNVLASRSIVASPAGDAGLRERVSSAGAYRVRMVALPPNSDPLKTPPNWNAVDGKVGVAEVYFTVEPGR